MIYVLPLVLTGSPRWIQSPAFCNLCAGCCSQHLDSVSVCSDLASELKLVLGGESWSRETISERSSCRALGLLLRFMWKRVWQGVLVCEASCGKLEQAEGGSGVTRNGRPLSFLLCMARQVCLLMMVVNKLVHLSLSWFHKLVYNPIARRTNC